MKQRTVSVPTPKSKMFGLSSMKVAETAWIVSRLQNSSIGSASTVRRQFANIVRR